MLLLSQTEKMKKSNPKYDVYNFGVPALITCPNADICSKGCYASSGRYNDPIVKRAYNRRYELSKSEDFVTVMSWEIGWQNENSNAKGKSLAIRINDSGDFYNLSYALKWIKLASMFNDVRFYAYTKEVAMFKRLSLANKIPQNLTCIFSLGGKQDSRIDRTRDRHAAVFPNKKELLKSEYADASWDDTVAFESPNHRIGLYYHGGVSKAWLAI